MGLFPVVPVRGYTPIIFKSRSHIRSLGARRVTCSKLFSEPTNIRYHNIMFSHLGEIMLRTDAPLVLV